MEHSTLSPAKQALLDRRLKSASGAQTSEIPRRLDPHCAPLSFSQHQMWVIDQVTPGNPAYNVPVGYRLGGIVDVTALERSFNAVIDRHEMLRTTFAVKNGEPLQLIHPELTIRIPITELNHLTRDEREARLHTLASEESVRSFDLSCLPLVRVSLFKLDDAEQVVIINLHHIVADGLSLGLMMDEVDTFYRAFTGGGDPRPPHLAVQYADFAAWQRHVEDEAASATQIEFWRKQLGGELPVLELPGDRPRPALQSFKGANVFFRIPVALTQELTALSAREGCTLFMTLLAAFQVLLHRYSGAEDIVVGTPVAVRSPGARERLIGDFLNMVALRCDASGDPAFVDFLRRSRNTTLDAFSNSDLPFEAVLKHLTVERDPSRNPLFQVVMQLLAAPAPRIGDLGVSNFHFDLKIAQFDLSLLLYQEDGGYVGRFAYCTDLFDAHTIQRLSGHYGAILQAIAREPGRRISMLPMLTETERHQLEVWNQTTVVYPAARCAHEMVEEQAQARPGALAADSGTRQLTYRELDEWAETLAARLRDHGVQAGSLVAIYLERSLEMLVALLATWKAGGAYVPIDPEYPVERVRFMLEDTNAVVVLTQECLSWRLPATEAAIVHLDVDADRSAPRSDTRARRPSPSPDQLAYVIYTSGSTGRPKGVPITHASLFNLICWHHRAYEVTPADRATQIAGPAFDASVWEIWPYLTAGASVHIPDSTTRSDAGQLVRWLADRRVTLTFLPTPLGESVLRESWPQTTALRVLLTGGDRLTRRPARKLPFRLVNHYGPTENTVVSTCAEVEQTDSNALPAIGRPLPNVQVHVLDRHLQPVPVGVPGQLLLGGVQLTPGYWNRPHLTAETFVRAQSGARLYKTGDLVRRLPDGNIDFLGRIDNQVKIRGFRIELGEIEAALDRHPGVRQSAVIVREEEPDRKQLMAYVVPDSGCRPQTRELREHLKDRLPEFMVPSVVVLLDALPMTTNGKIDRKALPAPDVSAGCEALFVAPTTPNEKILADIWSNVLRLQRVGVGDKFFELGGDSILSIQVIGRARDAGLRMTVRQMFQHQTIAELALVAENIAPCASDSAPVSGLVPFTPIQKWFLEQDFADPHHWNQAVWLEVRPNLDTEILEEALRHVLGHHDALRLRFVRHGRAWRQLHAPPDETASFRRIALSGLTVPEQNSALYDASVELQAQLDLAEGPLVRTALFDLGPERRRRLLMVIHHLAVDAVSWRILLDDLQTACRQLDSGEPITLPAKSCSFKEWAQRLNQHGRTAALRQEIDYWLTSAAVPAAIPVDFTEGRNSEASARVVSVFLGADHTRALLQQVPQAYKTRINEVLLSALGIVLTRWIGQPIVAIDMEGHGREDLLEGVDVSRTVGWFTTLFPVRLDLRGIVGPGNVLKSVKEQLRRMPQRGIGYGLLRYLSGDAKVASLMQVMPRPQVAFNYLGQFDLPATSPFGWVWESTGPLHSPKAHRSHLLEINSWVANGELRVDWTYSAKVHRRHTVERLAEAFVEELSTVIRHCAGTEAGGYSPSDFADAGLNQEALDRLISDLSEHQTE